MKNMRIFGFTAIGLAFGLSIQSGILFAKGESQKVKENIEKLIKTNSCVNCNLDGADFTRMSLVKVNLENANLKNAKFQLTDLSSCNLKNANLGGANFGGADLSNCDLQGATYSDKTLSGAYLSGVNYAVTPSNTEPQQDVKKVYVPQNIQLNSESKHHVEVKKSKPVPIVEKVQIAERRDFDESPPSITTAKAVSEKEETVVAVPVSKPIKSVKYPAVATKYAKPFQDVVIENTTEDTIPAVSTIEKHEKDIEKGTLIEEDFFEEVGELPEEDLIVEENIEPPKEELMKEVKDVENEKKEEKAVYTQQTQTPEQPIEKTVVPLKEVAVDAVKIALLEKLKDKKECFKCDLSGLDLSGKKFKKVDLEGTDFSNCNLEDTNFSYSNLKGVNFSGANLKGANFKKADLYKAVFSGADLTDASLTNALIDDAQLTDAFGVQVNSVMLNGGN